MDIHVLLDEIDSLRAKLETKPSLNEGEAKRLREQFAVEYTYNSNAIEGNTLTLHETALVVLEGLTIDKKPIKDHLEAIGHSHAYDYVVALSKAPEELTERTIKEVHALVLMEDPINKGKYRDVPVQISGALDTPPPPDRVPIEMKRLLDDYSTDKRHPIEKIAEFHILFERIHPFIDGNGRTGRLLLNLELIKAGFYPIDVKFKDRGQYIGCFRSFEETGNATQFVEMVARYELDELSKYLSILTAKESSMNG